MGVGPATTVVPMKATPARSNYNSTLFPQNAFDSSYTEEQANTGDGILERSVDQHSGVLQSVRGGVVVVGWGGGGKETGIPTLVCSGGRTERNLFWRRVWKFGMAHIIRGAEQIP